MRVGQVFSLILLTSSQNALTSAFQAASQSFERSAVGIRNIHNKKTFPQAHESKLAVTTSKHGGIVTTTALQAIPSDIVAAAASVALPSFNSVALACLLPTLSGFYRREYTVSYSYGTAIAVTAWLVLSSMGDASIPITSLASLHAIALIFYGVRLDLFLLYREISIPRFQKFREQVEEGAPAKRLERTPFIVGCAALYGFMASPLFLTATSPAAMVDIADPFASMSIQSQVIAILVGITWLGFLLGAAGDFQKSLEKLTKGDDHLVTGGIYKLTRHPNYTGEIIGWTASGTAAFVACWPNWASFEEALLLLSTVLGVAGIVGVLVGATTGLERKQEEKYGSTTEYQDWVQSSWIGFAKKTALNEET